MKKLIFCAAIVAASPVRGELLSFEATPSDVTATVRIDGREHRLAAKLLRTKTGPESGALLLYVAQHDDLSQTALARGMTIARLDLGGVPAASRAQALRDLLPRLKATLAAKRALAYGAGDNAAAVAGAGPIFDGLLLQDAGAGAAAAPRSIELWGSDAYWRATPRLAPAAGPEPQNRRSFFLAGTVGATGPNCASPGDPRGQAPALRALLVALDDWTKGARPPTSRVPAAKDLVPAATLAWPKIPGLPPPAPSDRLVPKIDADGNETGGLRLPDRALPIATFTGFAAQKDKAGPPCAGGAALPFPATKADREKTGDPRSSLVERYGSRAYFVATMRVVADKLVKERLLLKEDADAYVAAAKQAPF